MDEFELLINVYALLASVVGVALTTRKLLRMWRTRHIRRVWGIKDRDSVLVVCSELDDSESRQHVEDREFIYALKYGDLDAYVEIIVTLLRLYPNIKLRVMSAGEATQTRIDLARHIILIGGPDYNPIAARMLSHGITRFNYRSKFLGNASDVFAEEIVLVDSVTGREWCHTDDTQDFGYFERLPNPHNPKTQLILIGGCHTIGVAGAAKAFSMSESESGEIPDGVIENAAATAKLVKKKPFAILVRTERVGQSLSTPLIAAEHVYVQSAETNVPRLVPTGP